MSHHDTALNHCQIQYLMMYYYLKELSERVNSEGIKNLNIPNTVYSIGDKAFINCKSLTTISIPTTVKYIGKYAFQGCDELKFVLLTNRQKKLLSVGTFSKKTKIYTPDDGLCALLVGNKQLLKKKEKLGYLKTKQDVFLSIMTLPIGRMCLQRIVQYVRE